MYKIFWILCFSWFCDCYAFAPLVRECTLPNGLHLTCISDPKALFSAGGLEVRVGSWQDPKRYPGMAHLVEHLLFACARVNEEPWDAFITRFRGHSEAVTHLDRTCYSFSVSQEGLQSALQALWTSCITPISSPQALLDECAIIREEAAYVWQSDSARLKRMLQLHACPSHPFAQYHIGDPNALSQLTWDRVSEWKAYHYRPEAMRVMLISALPLTELEAMARLVCGGEVEKRKQLSEELLPCTLLAGESLAQEKWQGQISYVEGASLRYSLTLAWEIAADPNRSHLPLASSLAALLGEEGEGSLYAEYAQKGWALSISSGVAKLPNEALLLTCEWGVTAKGFQHDTEIVQGVMEALKRWKKEGIPLYYLEERQKQRVLQAFHEGHATSHARVLQWLRSEQKEIEEPSAHALSNWRSLCAQVIPETMHLVKMAPKGRFKIPLEHNDPLTGCSYMTAGFSKRQRQKWIHALPSLLERIPPPNPWMPHSLSQDQVQTEEAPLPSCDRMEKVMQSRGGTFYHHTLPLNALTAAWRMRWVLLECATPMDRCYRDLGLEVLRVAFERRLDTARRAGMTLQLIEEEDGLCIDVCGYHERLLDYLDTWVDERLAASIPLTHFTQGKQRMINALQERMRRGKESVEGLLDQASQRQLPYVEQCRLVKNLTLEEFLPHAARLLRPQSVDLIGVSSTPESKRIEWWKQLQSRIEPMMDVASREAPPSSCTLRLDEKPLALHLCTSLEGHRLVWMVECLKAEALSGQEAALELCIPHLKEALYSALRTDSQLVYAIDLETTCYHGSRFIVCSMQSHTALPEELLFCLERSIERFVQQERLASGWAAKQEAVVKGLCSLPTTPYAACLFMSDAIRYGQKDMKWKQRMAEKCAALSLASYQDQIRALLGKQNRKRIAFLFQGHPQEEELAYRTVRSWKGLWKVMQSSNAAVLPSG